MFIEYTDQQIIEAFRAGGSRREMAWEYVYKAWRERVISSISRKGGTKEEAIEALHAAAIGFQQRICQADFQVEHKLVSYFATCVNNEWIRIRKDKGKAATIELEDGHITGSEESTEDKFARIEFYKAVQESLGRIGERCKTILLLFFNEYNMKEIAERMGFRGGEQVAKNEKLKCLVRYENFLRDHPDILQHLKNLRNG